MCYSVCWRCWRRSGDSSCAAVETGGCGEWDLFAGSVGGAEGTEDDTLRATLLDMMRCMSVPMLGAVEFRNLRYIVVCFSLQSTTKY